MLSTLSEGPSIWCAVTADQLAQIAKSHWRHWAPDEKIHTTDVLEEAAAKARELAEARGAGHVLKLAVTSDFVERYPGGRVPPGSNRELVASLRHAISEYAHYRGSLSEAELEAVETALGRALPTGWRRHLSSPSWFHRGWMRTGAYVWLYPPTMSAELSSDDFCPGMFVIGGDGASEQLVLDLRDPSPPVMLANVVCSGWGETFLQAPSVASFLTEVGAGTFKFSFC